MSSYTLSERIDIHTVLFYGLALPVYRGAMAIDAACTAIGNAYRAFVAMLPALLFWLAILAKALGLVAIIAGTVAAVAMIPPTFWLGLAIVAAFGWLTYPRKQVRP